MNPVAVSAIVDAVASGVGVFRELGILGQRVKKQTSRLTPETIVAIVGEGVGVVAQLADLARRVQAGETPTDAELEDALAEVRAAAARWDAEADHDRE